MHYITLYRKYRPKLFSEIVGQKFIVQTLTNAIKSHKIGHAYIFAGPKGIGKTTIAKIFAKAINCLNPNNGDACNVCENCRVISTNSISDILELDAASNNGVDEVRNIISNVNYLPTTLNKKVYIIDEAHMLTTSAWNAMLKTIEEAPAHAIFIFATTEMYKIPSTIVSRCQTYTFNRLSHSELHNMIVRISKLEDIQITEEAIEKIITMADGSARDVLSILEQVASYTSNNVTLGDINKIFGLIDVQNKILLINLLLKKDTKQLIALIDKYEQNGVNFAILANDLTSILIDKLIYLQTKETSILKTLNTSNVDEINIDQKVCIALINVWQESYMKMKNSYDTRFYFELAVFSSFNAISTPQNEPKTLEVSNTPPPKIPTPAPKPTFHQITPEPKKEEKKIPVKFSTPDNFFSEVAYNYDKETFHKAESFLNDVKNHQTNKTFELMSIATKVKVASKNGIVLVFDDEIAANLFNKKNKEYDFLIEVNKYFNHPLKIIGYSDEKVFELYKDWIMYKKQGKFFDEINIDDLWSIVKAKSSCDSIAAEMFGSQ